MSPGDDSWFANYDYQPPERQRNDSVLVTAMSMGKHIYMVLIETIEQSSKIGGPIMKR